MLVKVERYLPPLGLMKAVSDRVTSSSPSSEAVNVAEY